MKRLSLFVVFMMVPYLVQAASFDCNKATTPVEKLICGSEAISKLDSQLGNAYGYVLDNTYAKAKKATLIADQKNWITTIRNNCKDADCLRNEYWSRINVLTLIKTNKSAARYVVDQNERTAKTEEFQKDLKRVGINGSLTACNLMVELIGQQGGRDQSYGAICNLNERLIMICDDTMIGKLTLKLYGFAITGATVVDFTANNCPSGG
jgi:uncharacterized protein